MSRELQSLAAAARASAYAPYSGYRVGAAVRSSDGRTFTGCNVENVSYGLTMCAERAALFAMVNGGAHQIASLALVTADGGTPCGACLQVLLEFSSDPASVVVQCCSEAGEIRQFTLAELIPHGFISKRVNRTEPAG